MSEYSKPLPTVSLELPHMKWVVLAMVAGVPLVGGLVVLLIFWFTGVFHSLILRISWSFGIATACGFAIAVAMCRKRFVVEAQGFVEAIKVDVNSRIASMKDEVLAGVAARMSAAHEHGVESGRLEVLENLSQQEFVIPAQCPHGASFVLVLRFGELISTDGESSPGSPPNSTFN